MKESTGFFGDPLPTSGDTGTELTVRELEEMACRQQHQIESQRQLLAAKEQRLRYLKQHDAKHHQVAAEHERLRRLRDRVEAQEQKLRKLRALRGQVDQTKLNNATLTSDLESIRALFNEKEKELTMAVAKVDELTRQLEDVHKGRGHPQATSPGSMELDKLRAELLYRNKLGEQQTARLVQQREVLSKRQEEMASIDRRISELQARLHRKRLLNQQLANQIQANRPGQNNRSLAGPGKQMMPLCDGKMSGGNVAAIEPFNHIPDAMSKNCQLRKSEDNILSHASGDPPQPYGGRNGGRPEMKPLSQQPQVQKPVVDPYQYQYHHHHHHQPPNNHSYKVEQQIVVGHPADVAYFAGSKFDPKYQTLPYNTKFSPSANYNGHHQPSQHQWFGQHEDAVSEENNSVGRDLVNNNAGYAGGVEQKVNGMTAAPSKKSVVAGQVLTNLGQNVQMQSSSRPINSQVYHTKPLSSSVHVAQRPINYSIHAPVLATRSQPVGGTGMSNHQKPTSSVSPIYQTSSTKVQPVQPQVLNSVSTTNHGATKTTAVAAAATAKEPKYSAEQPAAGVDRIGSPTVGKPALPPKPPPPPGKTSTPPPPPRQNAYHLPQYHQPPDASSEDCGRAYHAVDKPTPAAASQQKDLTPPPRIPNGNGPVKSNSGNSVDSSESDNSSGSASIRSVFGNVKNGGLLLDSVRSMSISTTKGSPPPPLPPPSTAVVPPTSESIKEQHQPNEVKPLPPPPPPPPPPPSSSSSSSRLPSLLFNRTTSYPVSEVAGELPGKNNLHHQQPQQQQQHHQQLQQQQYRTSVVPPPQQQPATAANNQQDPQSAADETDRVHAVSVAQRVDELETRFGIGGGGGGGGGGVGCGGSSSADENSTSNHSSSSPDSGQDSGRDDISVECRNRLVVRKKGNLKESSGSSIGQKRRVSFDPLALLLDASLEGELELVMRTAEQVGDPSAANDEGITALHNAICAGHIDIVKFLVKFGCDVNAQDSDGWTPLHCAASCNNLAMVRFLVEHGACIFATTLSDQETAAEKCEEDEEGFDGCSEFLYSVQEKLGIMNNGVVYAVFGYEAHNQDELTFDDGDRIVVLRKGDDAEREWWWSRIDDREGYVPRNLLGLYPRANGGGGGKKSTAE